jgi:hypothetical protein
MKNRRSNILNTVGDMDSFWESVRRRVASFRKRAPQWLIDASLRSPLIWGDSQEPKDRP